MLIEDYEEYFAPAEAMLEYQERRKEHRRGISGRRNADDLYPKALEEATQVVESHCRQVLRSKSLRQFLYSRNKKPAPHEWSDEAKKVLGGL